jgi:hypothetical protein
MIKILSIKEVAKLTKDGKTEEMQVLSLEKKGIEKVEELGGCKALRRITLTGNLLKSLSGLETNYQLTVLKVPHNHLT